MDKWIDKWIKRKRERDPLQINGWVTSSRSRFMDMTDMPSLGDLGGTIPKGEPVGMALIPNRVGMDGPVMSPSRMPTFCSRLASPTARRAEI